ncbi:PREDICTED: cleavage and polyadenylation specificity factor subunit CG7185-like [Chrysochloris asiatica]|uniref:Cleavage and polyadenylation specificity factor subunit CG7185-like n=1 Tax=Chrysochloris asiatica TaxID=185453 RepID=A0A9B0WKD0_CHRAS|nr:PREDICTED: cleavage and polyadenylation specificity factor subunit CG7185-like [Chrysochloris asiatica]
MLPWCPSHWDSGEEEAPEEGSPSRGSDPTESWSSGEETLEEPDSPPPHRTSAASERGQRGQRGWSLSVPHPSPQYQALCIAEAQARKKLRKLRKRRRLQPHSSPDPAAEQRPEASASSAPEAPQPAPPAPWDPSYQPETRSWQMVGVGSFSNRTLSHPSFMPLYEAAAHRGHSPLGPPAGHQITQQVPASPGPSQCSALPQPGLECSMAPSPGFPVLGREDLFFSDPLLPYGQQRVPMSVANTPQQMMGPMRLHSPPPIMSSWVAPTRPPGYTSTWQKLEPRVSLHRIVLYTRDSSVMVSAVAREGRYGAAGGRGRIWVRVDLFGGTAFIATHSMCSRDCRSETPGTAGTYSTATLHGDVNPRMLGH